MSGWPVRMSVAVVPVCGLLMDTVLSARKSGDKAELEDQLDEGLEETFPASDPVSASYSSTAGSNR